MTTKKAVMACGLLLVWGVLWYGSWQTAVSPFVRVYVSLLMFTLPGILVQQLFYARQPVTLSRLLTLGFVVSIGLTGMLALVAFALHLSIQRVSDGLFLIGAALLVGTVWRGGWRWQWRVRKRSDALILFVAGGIIVVMSFVAYAYAMEDSSAQSGDYVSYNTLVTNYAGVQQLTHREIFLGTDNTMSSRFWLALWPVSEAVLVNTSGLHILLLSPILKTWLMIIALLTVYELARALGFSRGYSVLAVVGYAAAVVQYHTANPDSETSPTRLFSMIRALDQDKMTNAFIIVPALFRVVVDSFRLPGHRWLLLLLVGMASALTHPTILALAAMIAGVYALLEFIVRRKWKCVLQVTAILAACALIFLPLRLLEGTQSNFSFSSQEAAAARSPAALANARIRMLPDTPFYGLNSKPLLTPIYLSFITAALLALLRVRQSRAARFLVASGFVLLLAVVPITGWLIGLVVTPFHLWRLNWLIPFGVALSYTMLHLSRGVAHVVPSQWVVRAVLPCAILLCVAGVLANVQYIQEVDESLRRLGTGEPFSNTVRSGRLFRFADAVTAVLDGHETVVLAYPRGRASYLPMMNANLKTVVFREEPLMARQAGISETEAAQRSADYERFIDPSASNQERLDILARYDVRLIVMERQEATMQALTDEYPDLFEKQQVDGFPIYRFDLEAYRARTPVQP